MEGHGGVQTLDQLGKLPTHGHLLKKIKKADGSFVVRDDVFVSYKKEDKHIKRPLSVGMGAWGPEWFGPELMFGIEMGDHFKAAQAKISKSPELKGTIGYVRTAPFWYPELDELPAKMEAEESRVRTEAANKLKKRMKDQPEDADPKKMEVLVKEAGDKALAEDRAYQKAKKQSDLHVCNWYCHYQGSARVYCLVGHGLAEAMKPLLATKP